VGNIGMKDPKTALGNNFSGDITLFFNNRDIHK